VTEFQIYKELLLFFSHMTETHSLVLQWNNVG
jgi:hypothetical protein